MAKCPSRDLHHEFTAYICCEGNYGVILIDHVLKRTGVTAAVHCVNLIRSRVHGTIRSAAHASVELAVPVGRIIKATNDISACSLDTTEVK